MVKLKCLKCGSEGVPNICFNFDRQDLELIAKGIKVMPKFRIGAYCTNELCGKWIKWLPFQDNLEELNNKFFGQN